MKNKILYLPLNHLHITKYIENDIFSILRAEDVNNLCENSFDNFDTKEFRKYEFFDLVHSHQINRFVNLNNYYGDKYFYQPFLKLDVSDVDCNDSIFINSIYGLMRLMDSVLYTINNKKDEIDVSYNDINGIISWGEIVDEPLKYSYTYLKEIIVDGAEKTSLGKLPLYRPDLKISEEIFSQSLFKNGIKRLKNNKKFRESLFFYNKAYELILRRKIDDFILYSITLIERLFLKGDGIKSSEEILKIMKSKKREQYEMDLVQAMYQERDSIVHKYEVSILQPSHRFEAYSFRAREELYEQNIQAYIQFFNFIEREIIKIIDTNFKYPFSFFDSPKDIDKRIIFHEIAIAKSEDKANIYIKNVEKLKDYSIIFVDQKEGVNDLEFLNEYRNKKENFEYLSLFYDDRLWFFNNEIYSRLIKTKKMEMGKEVILSLNSNVVEYLSNYYYKKSDIPNDIQDIFDVREKVSSIDAKPYLDEKSITIPDFKKDKFFYDTLFAFEKLFPYDIKNNPSNPDDSDLFCKTRVHETIQYLSDKRGDYIQENNKYKYNLGYIALLKMCLIELKYKKLNAIEKLEKFVDYLHNNLKIISQAEINLAYIYFKSGNNLKFFKSINKNNSQIIDNIKNMAWTLFHINNMSFNFLIKSSPRTDFVIPIFVTYNEGIDEIKEAFQFDTIIFSNKEMEYHRFYKMLASNEFSHNLQYKYFSGSVALQRISDRKLLDENHDQEQVKKLEQEILEFINSKQ